MRLLEVFKRPAQILAIGLLATWSVSQATAATSPPTYNYTIGNGGLLPGFSVSVDHHLESGIYVGGIAVAANPAGSGVPGYDSFTTVCLDLSGRIYPGATYGFTREAFSGQTGLNPYWGNPLSADPSATTAYQAMNNAAYLYANHHPANATDWAALQLAVWKVLYDTAANGSVIMDGTSRFVVSSDASSGAWAEAQGWLNNFHRTQDYAGFLLRPTDLNAQELLIGVTPVPEPTTVIAGFGALGLLLFGAGVHSKRSVLRIGK